MLPGISLIVLSLGLLCQELRHTQGLSINAPRSVVSEYYGSPYYENLRPLTVAPNGDLIVGENTSKGIKKLLFECKAGYPVQWIYQGDGVPEITADTNMKRSQYSSSSIAEFGATLSISKLAEAHSGNYTCRGVQNKEDFVSYYLYVPGPQIFTSVGGDKVTYSFRDATARIPCSVSHPGAIVTLQKSINGMLSCPLNDSISFSPKTGFTLRLYNMYDPSGTYVCTANFNNSFKAIHFDLIGRYEQQGNPGTCTPSACGRNAECRVSYTGRIVCACPMDYIGDPYTECRRNDYPSGLPAVDPCTPSPCGKYGDCLVRNGLAACTCMDGYVGKPPHCVPVSEERSCIISQNCPVSQPLCLNRKCVNPCTEKRSRCGRNADCRIVNRTPVCSCPPGYAGDPHRECRQQPFLPNRPYEELEERLRPECQHDDDCSAIQACIHQRCQNPCPVTCGHTSSGPENCLVLAHKAYCNQGTKPRCSINDPECNSRLSNGFQIGGCHRKSCGPNSECRDNNGEGICSCLPGYTGTPPYCTATCYGNSGCEDNQVCLARKCQDPCEDVRCGFNAKCVAQKHKAECVCLNGYVGDAKIRCSLVPGSLLEPICSRRCGPGAKCVFVNNTATCKCIDPYDRSCKVFEDDRCYSDDNCPRFAGCFNGVCKNPCDVYRHLCGQNQECRPINHKAECSCKPGFPIRVNNDCFKTYDKERSEGETAEGNQRSLGSSRSDEDGSHCDPPFCRRGNRIMEAYSCRYNADCPSSRMCVEGRCVDMCSDRMCGINAACIIVNRRPQCSCPPGFVGSPAVRCFPIYRYLNEGDNSTSSEREAKTIILLEPEGTNDSSKESDSKMKELTTTAKP